MTAPASHLTSELRIPADRRFIVVAKRAAAGFGTVAGFGVEAIDDLSIAVAQACENAVTIAERAVGPGRGQVRLVFKLEDGRLDIQVRSTCSTRVDDAVGVMEGEAAVGAAGAAAARAQARIAADAAARRDAAAVTDLALRVMSLFVDDCRYRVDERTGGLRVRLTKYRAS